MLISKLPSLLTWKYFRYIYVGFAADLAAAGEKLLNILITVVVVAFSLQWIIIYPIIGRFHDLVVGKAELIHSCYVVGHASVNNYPLHTIKGKVCTQTFIEEFDSETQNRDFNLKPKFILFTICRNSI